MSREIKLCENECCYSTNCGVVIDLEDNKFRPSSKHADFICFKENKIILIELKNIRDFENSEDAIRSIKDKIYQTTITKNGIGDSTISKMWNLYCNQGMNVNFYVVVPREVKGQLSAVLRGIFSHSKKKFHSIEILTCNK